MSLTNITFVPLEQPNLVVQAKPGLFKVASAASGTLGTVSAIGSISGTVSWSLVGNPGGAISISAQNDDPTKADITFTQVPIRTEPWLLMVQASTLTDGKVIQIPLAILVREAFSIREAGHPAGDFTVTGQTCDPDLPALSFQGYGPGGAEDEVKFITPTSLPTGLAFGVDDSNTAYLTPAKSTLENPTGGIPGNSGVTYSVVLQAYRAGTLYDTPENPATLRVTYDLTAGPRIGTLVFNLGASYDRDNTQSILLDAAMAFVHGKVPAAGFTIEWTSDGQGTWGSAGTQDVSNSWTPDTGVGAQNVTLTATIRVDGSVVATATAGPFPITDELDWTAGANVPVSIYPEKLYPQEAGKKVYFRTTLPDLVLGETAIVSYSLVSVGSAAPIADAPGTSTIVGGDPSLDAVVGFTIPAGASLYDMWRVEISVAVTGGTLARTGYAQLLAICSGSTPLIIQVADTTLSGNTGSVLTPVTLRSYRWSQNAKPASPTNAYINPIAGVNNSTLVEVTGVSYRISGAPEGIVPVLDVPSGFFQITGLMVKAGTFAFTVQALRSNYRSGADSIENVVLVAGVSQVRMTFTAFGSTNPTVAGGQGFTLNWGIQGTGTVTLQVNNHLPPEDVTGSQSSAIPSITSSSVYILRGSGPLGESLSSPILVELGATGSSTQLPPSPSIVTIDEKEHCVAVWQPSPINNTFAPYANWQISAKDDETSTPYLITKPDGSEQVTGLETPYGGTPDARRYEFDFVLPGYHELSMKALAAIIPGQLLLNSLPWDTFKIFPSPRTATLDKATASKGEAITMTISGPNIALGNTGDRWQAVYSDGTSSDWFPMSILSVAKSFATGGAAQTIKLVVESDYGTSYPPVKLRRTTTLNVYIQDQDYLGTGEAYDITGAVIGVGGDKGFEISSNLDGALAAQPYMVVVPALVRDDLTNELKLLVATSRGRDASSLMGTMAIDVFPLAGRPHTLDLVKIPENFLQSDGVLYDPVTITQDALPDVIVGQNVTPVLLQAKGGVTPYRWFSMDLPYGLSLSRDGRLSGTVQKLGRFAIVLSVQDSQNPSSIDDTTLYLTAKSDLSIVAPALTSPVVGEDYKGQLVAQRGIQPYTWEKAAGSLPGGLTLNIDGSITGWPTTYNTNLDLVEPYIFVAQVTDAIGAMASRQITLNLLPMPLQVSAPDQSTIVQGESFKLKFPVVGGYPGYTLVGVPSAPVGFIESTKIVNGMIEVVTKDSYRSLDEAPVHIGIRVRDSKNTEAYAEYTIEVRSAIPVARWSAPSFDSRITDSSSSQSVALTGATSGVTYDAIEILPPLQGVVGSGDAVKGNVSLLGPVTYERNQEVMFRAVLKQGPFTLGVMTREYTILAVMGDVPNVWTLKTLPLRRSDFFAMDLQAAGLNAPTPQAVPATYKLRIKEAEVMPKGVSLDENSGVIYGAIRAIDGPASTKLEMIDSMAVVQSTITIEWVTVDRAIQIDGTLPDAEVGRTFDGILTVSGAASSVVAEVIHGRLPDGIAMEVVGNLVQFTGRPMETGYFDLWIRIRDTQNRTGLYTTRLVVDYLPYLAISTVTVPKIIQGFAFASKLAAIGGKPGYTWEVDNGYSLPVGIALLADGTITGTTPLGATGDTDVSFTATDSYGQTASKVLTISVGVAPPLVITTTSLPNGQVGAAYIGAQLQVTGGVPGTTGYVWPQVSLPAGLSLDSSNGLISGTPTEVNSAAISFKVRDSLGVETTKALVLKVILATSLHIETETLVAGRVNEIYGASGTHAPAFVPGDMGLPRVGGYAVTAKFGLKNYILTGGGNCALRGDASEVQAFGDVQIMDPDVVVNGVQVGQYATLATEVQDLDNPGSHPMGIWNLRDRAFAAAVQISGTEFVLIGGAHLGGTNLPSYDGYTGRAIQTSLATTEDDVTAMSVVCFVTTDLINNQHVLKLTPGPVLTSGVGPTPAPGTGLGVGEGRYGMAGCLMHDGRIFACGGTAVVHTPGPGTTVTTMMDPRITGKEVYLMTLGVNRSQSSWVRVADMPVALVCPQAVTLSDGRILVTGGLVRAGVTYSDIEGSTTSLIYTPNTNTWATGPTLPSKAFAHSMVTLADGRVFSGGAQSTGNPGAIFVLNAAYTTWTQWLAYTAYAPSCWGNVVILKDGMGFWMGGVSTAPWADITDGAGTKALFAPDYTNYASEDALQTADYSGKYPWAAESGKFGTYLFNTNTLNTIKLEAVGGVTPYTTWTASAVPTGMTLEAATGILSGTPTVAFDQVVDFTCKDSTAPAAGGPKTSPIQPIRLTIMDPNAPIWVTKSLPDGYLEEAYSTHLVAKDGNNVILTGTFSISPLSQFGLPTGIVLSEDGTLAGTTSTPWAKNVTFRVVNPNYPTLHTDHVFNVNFSCNTQISVQTPPAPCPGADYSYQIKHTGGKGPYAWSVPIGGDQLPTGLLLDAVTGVVAGIPAPAVDKDLNITINVTDPNGCTGSATLVFRIRNSQFLITPKTMTATYGSTFSQTLSVAGGVAPYRWTLKGLPVGFDYNATTGIISTKLVAALPKAYPLTVTIKDATNATDTQVLTLTVVGPDHLWFSGPQLAAGAPGLPMWTDQLAVPPLAYIPLIPGMIWDYRRRGTAKVGWLAGDPWTIVVRGNFTSSAPTLTIKDYKNQPWLTDLISMNSDKTEARFGVSMPPEVWDGNAYSLPIMDWTNPLSKVLSASLNDSGTVLTNTFGLMVPSAPFAATSLLASDSTGVALKSVATYSNTNGYGFIAL